MFRQLKTTKAGLERTQIALCGLRPAGAGICCIARVEDESVQLRCTGALGFNRRYQRRLAGIGQESPANSPSMHRVLDSTFA